MHNRSLRLLLICNGIFILAGAFLGPLYAVYVETLAPGILPISISWAAFMISATIFTYIVGKYGDGIKKKQYMLMASYAIRAVVWLGFIFINSIESLIFLQIILGIGEALGTPAYDAIFAEHLDENKHISEYASSKVVEKLAIAVATILGGLIVSKIGFDYLFVLMSSLALVSVAGVASHQKYLE